MCVINPNHKGLEVYQHFRTLGASSIDFLWPDVTHDSRHQFYPQLAETPIADYLIPIFDTWYAQDDPDVHVRLFWSILKQMMGGEPECDVFGNLPMSYLVIESDGDIEALDALKVCQPGITKAGLSITVDQFADLSHASPLVRQFVNDGMPPPSGCNGCHERSVCGGGYLPHRFSKARSFDNPSVWCRDILKLFGHMRFRLLKYGVP